ncbi:YgiQ family radical SAM protein [Spirochaetia bacterium]|nr:YgiQ family radical SAM protein [Spirochaetia bacterium]
MALSPNLFLPVDSAGLDERGWDRCDFIFVSADAYVDHPGFAAALIGRVLEDAGFRVGIIPQPDWKNPASYGVLGRPRLAFLAGAGNMDSMVAHYTAARKPRSEDAYSPGGKPGFRPDRALLKYVEGIRSVFSDVVVIIGGIEASLRRFAHYDYWSDKVRRSILLDSKADILVYGMGEKPLLEIARRLAAGEPAENVPGTSVRSNAAPEGCIRLPDYEAVRGKDPASLRLYAEHFMIQKLNADPATAKPLAELSDGGRWVIQNPPAFPLSQAELDHVYELPFLRRAHPMYDAAGGIPAAKETAFSLVSSRGCFGGCSFCAITFHQGRAVTGRSRESLLREAAVLTEMPDFKGYIHDVGGPTANFYTPPCERQKKGSFCPERECLWPEICPQLKADHGPYLELLDALSGNSQKIKKVFIRSGIRYDYINHDKSCGKKFLETLCRRHVSGQLKVAPEHTVPRVLAAMGKNTGEAYEQFRKDFADVNSRLGLKQYLIPYFISGHPGSTLEDAADLARYLKQTGFVPDQAQDFYPTPGTLSTVMYHTGLDPRTMEPIYAAKGEREKKLQKALLHFNHPENKTLVEEALKKTGRNHV